MPPLPPLQTAAPLNYATQYQHALEQEFPFVLNFGALYATPNNGRYRWVNARTVEIPTIETTGRVDADRDRVTFATRQHTNTWEPYKLENHRMWRTLVHPEDIRETNAAAAIANITRVYNETQKFPEMDAYCISKIVADRDRIDGGAGWRDTVPVNRGNVIEVFNGLMLEMDNRRVPTMGRILYVTPAVRQMINWNREVYRSQAVQDASPTLHTAVGAIDNVQIVTVPPELMRTSYNFDWGWKAGEGAHHINMALIHPVAVLCPTQYEFATLEPPGAMSEGKWVYYEESYEDTFVLKNKAAGVQMNITAGPAAAGG